MLDRLNMVKETLMNTLQSQMGNLQNVDAKELGEVVDMVKDLEEAIYYCTITKAMEGQDKEGQHKEVERHYYTERPYYPPMDYNYRNMYYGGNGSNGGNSGRSSGNGEGMSRDMYYTDGVAMNEAGMEKDRREGRSGMSRRTYMEAKDMKKGQAMQMKELEHYIQELSNDLTEMIGDATAEEKNLLKQHLKTISEKIK